MNTEEINAKIEALRQEQDTVKVASSRWFEINDEIEILISQRRKSRSLPTPPTEAQLRVMDWVMSNDYDND